MSRELEGRHFWIIGPGRLGLALGRELLANGAASRLSYRAGSNGIPRKALPDGEAVSITPPDRLPPSSPDAILIAVPDATIQAVAEELARASIDRVPVLHASGVLGSDVLSPLRESGHSTGSFHPLVSIADPERDARKLRGAWFGIEGAPRALALAREMVAAFEGQSLEVSTQGKPLYHAAAVIASNYAVALLGVAERVMREAGVDAVSAREALNALAGGAVENVGAVGPVDALTGPISRGDAETVSLHLGRLSPEDLPLYSVLAKEALLLSRARGLAPDAAERITTLLERALP